ncbi:28S ribosomal protein S16, mitochondrial isoform X2 [Tympanuchus pallidicinctus]|uniref:28S ribosomal protein S16, mitochondrial isoform X2 n=1 Tax=Tympanuchus pallidicinctus TaxID=109042 RepID=UPI0022874488|nr:28S ribosomal protein S16, mitochondrial isoform X2 [Tympanuchus pallidicinctus]
MVQLGSGLLKSYRGGHVVIRFALGGCTNRPFYRIVAAHSKRARDGKYLEQLGCLDPLPNAHGEKVAGLNLERLRHWLGCGAQLSRPAEKLLEGGATNTTIKYNRISQVGRNPQGSFSPTLGSA